MEMPLTPVCPEMQPSITLTSLTSTELFVIFILLQFKHVHEYARILCVVLIKKNKHKNW